MRSIRLISILLFTASMCFGAHEKDSVKTGNPSGFLDIIVQSNINRLIFNYDLNENCLPSANAVKTNYDYDPADLRILIPVRDFQSRNKSVYKDFLTLLKADQFPYLEIIIPQNPGIFITENSSGILHNVMITVAGVSKNYDIDYSIEKTGTQNDILLGLSRIRLTDFGLEPPVKFSGLVKVRDEIIVKFGFCLKNKGKAVKST